MLGVLVCLLAVGTASGSAPSVAPDGQADYTLTTEQSTPFPPRTFTFQSQPYTVSKVAQVDAGDSLTVHAGAPDDGAYRLLLYNTDRQIVTARRGSGDGTFTLDLSGYDPGSYMLTLYDGGDYLAFHPVLVRGYAVDRPRVQPAGEGELRVATAVSPLGDSAEAFTNVSVVVANESHTVFEQNADRTGGAYEATVSTTALAPGTYHLYVGVRGSDESFGRDELLGVTSTQFRVGADGTATGVGTATPTGSAATPTATESPTASTGQPSPTPTTQPGFGAPTLLLALGAFALALVGRGVARRR